MKVNIKAQQRRDAKGIWNDAQACVRCFQISNGTQTIWNQMWPPLDVSQLWVKAFSGLQVPQIIGLAFIFYGFSDESLPMEKKSPCRWIALHSHKMFEDRRMWSFFCSMWAALGVDLALFNTNELSHHPGIAFLRILAHCYLTSLLLPDTEKLNTNTRKRSSSPLIPEELLQVPRYWRPASA